MSHVDAKQALSIYRHFCKQTERVVEYLGVAKKLQNLLSVPVPNLKFVRSLPHPALPQTLLTL
jgi:phosphatidylinositol-binding clathrin assembly protein